MLIIRVSPTVQRGIALPIALIMLVILMIGSVGLVRTIDTAVLISGNMAFKHSATLAADQGISAAVNWLATQTTAGALNTTNTGQGYCSSLHNDDSSINGWDPATNWSGACTPFALTADSAGNRVDYLIHRLCANPNTSPSSQAGLCSTATGTSVGFAETSSRRTGRDLIGTTVVNIAYRITVRVQSARGTRSFVQSTVLLPDNTI
jgi:type IV pilus assembly protein PilX